MSAKKTIILSFSFITAMLLVSGCVAPDPTVLQQTRSNCTDSDEGRNYLEKGSTIVNGGIEKPDQCVDDYTLKEMYCDENNTAAYETYECPNCCLDGACIEDEKSCCAEPCEGLTCVDGDLYDVCSCPAYTRTLVENCTYGCENGTCLATDPLSGYCGDGKCGINVSLKETEEKTLRIDGAGHKLKFYAIDVEGLVPIFGIDGDSVGLTHGEIENLNGIPIKYDSIRYIPSWFVAIGGNPTLNRSACPYSLGGGADISNLSGFAVDDELSKHLKAITSEYLPDLLAAGSIGNYKDVNFSQRIVIGTRKIKFDFNSGVFHSAKIYLDLGYDPSDPLYTYEIEFSQPINLSDPDILFNEMRLFGEEYVIMYSYYHTEPYIRIGSYSDPFTIQMNQPLTVSYKGEDYDFAMLGISQDESTVIFSVNGSISDLEMNGSFKIRYAQGINIMLHRVNYDKQDYMSSTAEMSIINHSMSFRGGSTVRTIEGTDETSIPGTLVKYAKNNGFVSMLTMAISGPSLNKNYLVEDGIFYDPLWDKKLSTLFYYDSSECRKSSASVIVGEDNGICPEDCT